MNRLIFFFVIFLASCSARQTTIVKHDSKSFKIPVDGKLFNAVYMQTAAEYRALCFQAYNYARLRVDDILQKSDRSRRLAIVSDIDETLLNNSPFAAHQGLMGMEYDAESWYAWTSRAEADSIPGACSFLRYAKASGIEIFYITNRDEREREATLRNLQKFGFPDSDSSHLLLRMKTSGKEDRRQMVSRSHEIVLLLGDNLADFSNLFDKKSLEERKSNTDKESFSFGNRFIVLPNAGYGDWESALYRYQKLSAAQKDSLIRADLKSY